MATTMYSMKPIFAADQVIERPSCMYHLKNLYGNLGTSPAAGTLNERQRSPGEVAKLEAVQEDILKKLSDLKCKLEDLRKMVKQPVSKSTSSTTTYSSTCSDLVKLPDVVVTANPASPPYGLLALRNLWAPGVEVSLTSHAHSTLKAKVPEAVHKSFNTSSKAVNVPTLGIRVIWANVPQAEVITSPAKQVVKGEVNILRLLSRFGPSQLNIDMLSAEEASKADIILDQVHSCLNGSLSKSAENAFLGSLAPGSKGWLLGQGPSIIDIGLWACLKKDKSTKCPAKLSNWLKSCDSTFGK